MKCSLLQRNEGYLKRMEREQAECSEPVMGCGCVYYVKGCGDGLPDWEHSLSMESGLMAAESCMQAAGRGSELWNRRARAQAS